MTQEEWLGMEDICFVTGKIIRRWEHARFTHEFDAWISKEGQKTIEEDARGSNPSEESRIIFGEWYAEDASVAGREQMRMEANAENDEFRRGWRPVRRGWTG